MRTTPAASLAVVAWCLFGIADLVNAVTLGLLNASGPLGLLTDEVTTEPLTTLPPGLIPTFLVPLSIILDVIVPRPSTAMCSTATGTAGSQLRRERLTLTTNCRRPARSGSVRTVRALCGGGTVLIEMLAGQGGYAASTRNGVTTLDYPGLSWVAGLVPVRALTGGGATARDGRARGRSWEAAKDVRE